MKKLSKNNKGFSLVELIVVIAIMAVLIGVLAPQFIKYVEKSRVSTDLQNMESVKTQAEVLIADEAATSVTVKIEGSAKTIKLINGTDITTTALKSSNWSGTAEYEVTSSSDWAIKNSNSEVTTTTNGVDYTSKSAFNIE